MTSVIRTFVLLVQAAFAAYNLYLARDSITKLGKYEETGRKLAKYSNSVQNQMNKTRDTQASGTMSVCVTISSPIASSLAPGTRHQQNTFTYHDVRY